jgi:tetratricopeptide (TPR) repeat protein
MPAILVQSGRNGCYDGAMHSGNFLASALRFILLLAIALCAACTPQQMLLNALVPDGTASVLLGNLQSVPDANRQRIAEMERQGDWAGLAKFAEQNIAKDQFSAEWRLIGGYACSQLRDYPRAIAHFSELVRLAPDDATGYHFLAETQRAAGQPERAVATLERALLVVRESPLTYQLLGEANTDLARYVPAAAAYRRALAIDPKSAEAWFGLGRASVRLARGAEAREALQALEQLRSPRAAELRAMITG